MSSRLKTALAGLLVAWACLAGPALSSDRVMIFAAASTAPAIEEIGDRRNLPWVVVPAVRAG